MASSYTTNLAIEKPAAGDKTGTWGTTVNINSDIIDQAINGVVSLILTATGSTSTPNDIDITEGSISDGRNQFIELTDTADLGGTVYLRLTPNNAEKICYLRNSLSASRNVVVFQGTYNASNAYTLTNGKDVVLKFNGGGASATVEAVFQDVIVEGISTTTLSLNGTAITATGTEINYVDGVTSNVQTQLDAKASAANPTFTGTSTIPTAAITTLNLGGTDVTATAAELNYVDGVTSAIQTQLDAKAPIASPTFTGTITVPLAVFNGSIEEQVFNMDSDGGTNAIDPANGTIQYKSISGATTLTEVLTDGEYVTLMLQNTAGDTVTWPATSWVGGSPPTLETTGYNVIALWKVANTLYGAFAGAA